MNAASDEKYLDLILDPVRVSANYRPKFGLGRKGIELEEFTELYGSDPFYSWVGLDSPLVYAAHKTAGGMTSIYRQLGIGCERLFRALLQDAFDLDEPSSKWEYSIPASGGRQRTLKLDGRIDVEHIHGNDANNRVVEWLSGFREKLDVQTDVRGAVFEVRQGYKSKDSKRQNADIANAANAYTQRYLPVLALMSRQIDSDLKFRYEGAKWGFLVGSTNSDDTFESTYAFCNHILGYDLASFFDRNSNTIRSEVEKVIYSLLDPS